jgi:hypothetical protein
LASTSSSAARLEVGEVITFIEALLVNRGKSNCLGSCFLLVSIDPDYQDFWKMMLYYLPAMSSEIIIVEKLKQVCRM